MALKLPEIQHNMTYDANPLNVKTIKLAVVVLLLNFLRIESTLQ